MTHSIKFWPRSRPASASRSPTRAPPRRPEQGPAPPAGAATSPNATPKVVNSSGTAVAFGSATALTFTSGVAAVSSSRNGLLRIYAAGPAEISASEGARGTAAPLGLEISATTASKFILAAATTTPAAGEDDTLTVTAQDAYGNVATSYDGSKSLIFSGASASPGGNTPTVTNPGGTEVAFGSATAVEFDGGVAKGGGGDGGTMALYKSGATSVKVTEGRGDDAYRGGSDGGAGSGFETRPLLLDGDPGRGGQLQHHHDLPGPLRKHHDQLRGGQERHLLGGDSEPQRHPAHDRQQRRHGDRLRLPVALTFTAGVAAVSSSKNGLGKLSRAGATSVTASDDTIATATPLALTVGIGTASRLAVAEVSASAGTIGSPCLFTCAVTALGNSGTISANASITDSVSNVRQQRLYHTITAASTGYTSATATATR